MSLQSSRYVGRFRGSVGIFTGLLTLLLLPIVGCGDGGGTGGEHGDTTAAASGTEQQAPTMDPVERGKFLVTIGGCNDCHTPFKMGEHGAEPDMSRMLSGHPEDMEMPPPPKMDGPWLWAGAATNTAFAGPWGITYSPNLTPDSLTGIGAWGEEVFVKALKTGKHMGTGRPIMPPMPWMPLSTLPEEDLKAMYAFLMTVPAIKNQAPAYQPPAGAPVM